MPLRRLVFGLVDHLLDEILLGFFPGQAGDLLELAARFVHLPVALQGFFFEIFLPRLERLLASRQLALALVYGLDSFIDALFFADQAFFLILQFTLGFAHLLFEFPAFFEHTIFGLDFRFFFDRRWRLFSLPQ